MIQQSVARYIEKNRLFSLKDKVLVALSGGADSVALLHILLRLGYTCEAAHCNFRLRGEESDRDERFVTELCLKLNTPLHITGFDTEPYARSHKISIEMAARQLRYQWFEKLREETGVAVTAVAHHRDDSVETILLNLIRGTGINGLTGIRPVNGCIVRPLLGTGREEITEYLRAIGQDYVTDSTNLKDEYTRNKIRLRLLPLMQEINPSVKESIAATGNHLNDALRVYRHAIGQSLANVRTAEGIRIDALLAEPSPQAALFEALYPLGFNTAQIENIYDSLTGQSGKVFVNNNNWRVLKDRELLYIEKADKEQAPTPPFTLVIEEQDYSPEFIIPRSRDTACFDAGKVTRPFGLRLWQHGDTFVPFGMTGKKKVSDYLTDRKVPLIRKENQWVLCSGKQIAWLVNERADNRFRIDGNTRRIVIVRTVPKAPESNT